MLIAIISGNCYDGDCSTIYILMPDTIDIEQQWHDWKRWYTNVYLGGLPYDSLRLEKSDVKYVPFPQWLVENAGARYATENEIILFNEDTGKLTVKD